MSISVINWVLQTSASTGNDRLVLIAIADEANDFGGNAFPSVDTIARKARIDRKTVLRSVVRLEDEGELLVKRAPPHSGRKEVNRYVVVMERNPLALAKHVGWEPPHLREGLLEHWSQIGTTPAEGEWSQNPSEWSQSGPGIVPPDGTGPSTPYPKAREERTDLELPRVATYKPPPPDGPVTDSELAKARLRDLRKKPA